MRRALVAVELALTTILLIGAGLMIHSLQRVLGLDRGLNSEQVASGRIAFPGWSAQRGVRLEHMKAIIAALASQRGVTSAGFVNDLPIADEGILMDFAPVHSPIRRGPDDPGAHWMIASSGYFPSLGIVLQRGRLFTDTDDSLAPPVAIISESIARKYWPGKDPLGGAIRMGNDPPATIIGVVSDVREQLERDPLPQLYFPMAATPVRNVTLVVRGTLPRAALLSRLTAAVRYVDPSQPVFDVQMMEDVVGHAIAPRRTDTMVIALFSALALLLASLGVYAVVAHSVAQRSREFGIRSALGATGSDLLSLVSREMVWVTGIGIAAGLAIAWALARVASSLLYGVTGHDTATFVVVPLILLLPAAVATLVPARRALRVNPAEVMRAE